MNEIDIPCSDCDTDLVERMVSVEEVPVLTSYEGLVKIAECPSCKARYYPTQTLSQLTTATNNSQFREDT
jgi:uncharacterized protein with PIN domain